MAFPQVLGESGQERLLQDLPDINLRLVSTEMLDQRLVRLDNKLDRDSNVTHVGSPLPRSPAE